MKEATLLMNLSVFLPQEQGVSHSLLVFALGFEWGGFTDILSISAALSQHALKVAKTGQEVNQVPRVSGSKLVSSGGGRVKASSLVRMQGKTSRQETISSELCARMN